MRAENLKRLNNLEISKSNKCFLHYEPYHKSLFYSIKKYAKGDVLDIGCGNKPYENMFHGIINKYIGCDIIQSDLNKVDIISFANNIPLEDESFETIISTQTIEHVEDHQGLVNEAYRILKKDGYFIVSGPLYWHLHEEPYDFFRFTKYGYRYILEKAGFKVIEINSNGGAWATAGQALVHAIYFSNATSFFAKKLKRAFYRLKGIYLINSLFYWLDRKDYNDVNTMNYVVVCHKN